MTSYIANAVDIPATMSGSNGDYVRTGGTQALQVAGDGQFVTYAYANSSDRLPSVSGGFQPLPTMPATAVIINLTIWRTMNFINPGPAATLLFTIIQPTDPGSKIVSSSTSSAVFTPGFQTVQNGTTFPVTTNALRLGTLRWTIAWNTLPLVVGQTLTIDRIWIDVQTSGGSALTAPVFSTGVGRFDTRKEYTITG